jgi:hypothetical protein
MNPKDKAENLVVKFKDGLWKDRAERIYSEDAIYCALIAVEEILEETSFEVPNIRQRYWQEVKQEINNL